MDEDCPTVTADATCEDGLCRFRLPPPLKGDPNVAFIYVGPVGDFGWTKTHDQGRQYLEQHLPNTRTVYTPSVDPVDAIEVMEQMIDDGANVVIATSASFMSKVQEMSANNPSYNFLISADYASAPNMGAYFGKMRQAMWLAGKTAAKASRSGRIGIVGSLPIPEIIRHINAFTLGAQSINPEAKVMVDWIHAWYDPENEIRITQELVSAGADTIYTSTDTPIALDISKDLIANDGDVVYSIGNDSLDACELFAPDTCLTTPYWNWGPLLVRLVGEMRDGTWDPRRRIWEGIKGDASESIIYLAPLNRDILGLDFIVELEGLIQQLAMGEIEPYTGPIVDVDGATRIPTGERLSDEELLRICWFVRGVIKMPEGGRLLEEGEEDIPAQVPASCVGDR
ncbi:BMP family ABC transporter substrate-binding protein [Myxococcota bacterium]|nr:BMP family ABC transporter substrate-binding protein [Myxococcota bacterium]MBU1431910.1 BMP family ABC transporter substrate-binding protein [Myxococcota bacterium]MBU1897057.1 BMP family ABC transporter substrate-binding protein [Myxococcota bacterium]